MRYSAGIFSIEKRVSKTGRGSEMVFIKDRSRITA
jgi:hypothetical protein